MSANTTEDCASDDKLCIALEHDLAVIVVPSILLILFVLFLLCFILLRYCTKVKSPKSNVIHSYGQHRKTQLQEPPNNNHHGNHHHNHHHGNHHPNHHHGNHPPNDHHSNHHPNNHHSNHHPNNHHTNHHPNNHHTNHHPNNHHSNRHSSPHRNHRHRSQLQGIDAPAGINPLEHEEVPMTVQHTPPVAAVPRAATERQHRAFSEIRALPQTLFLRPDASVSLFRAQMEHRDVVLRVLKGSSPAAEKQRFLGFASFVSGLGPHPFIPALLGVISVTPPLMIVTEELQHRDLLGFLWRCRQDNSDPGCDITEKRIYTMGLQVASALDYLHSQQCVHGNLAARSVLVGCDLTVKLWGLGSAFCRSQRGAEGGLGGAEALELRKWQAPEVLAQNRVTKNSDVLRVKRFRLRPMLLKGLSLKRYDRRKWSFGILLYEMVTLGTAPFPELRDTELLQFLQRGKFMKKPASCSNTLYTLIKSCCQWSPQQRVSVPELRRRLEAAERTANSSAALRVPEPLDLSSYMREAGYTDTYDYAVF